MELPTSTRSRNSLRLADLGYIVVLFLLIFALMKPSLSSWLYLIYELHLFIIWADGEVASHSMSMEVQMS